MTPPLDHRYYPHIVDEILAHASREVLLAFRATSRAFHTKADRALFRHVAIDHWDRQYRPSLVTPSGARLPMRWQDEDATPAERARWLARLRKHTTVVDYCRSFNAYIYDPELADFLSLSSDSHTLGAAPLSMVRRVHADSVMDTFMPVLRARTAVDFVALTKLQVDGQAVPGNTTLFPTLADKWVVNLVFNPAVPCEAIALNAAHPRAMEQTREFVFNFTALGSAAQPCTLLDGPVGRAIIAIRPYLPAASVTFVGAHTLDRALLGLEADATDAQAAAAIVDAVVDMDGYPTQDADEEALRAAIHVLSTAEYKACTPDAELELGVHAALSQRASIINAPDEVRAHSRRTIKQQPRRRAPIARTPIDRVVTYSEETEVHAALDLALAYADNSTLLAFRGVSKCLLRAADSHLFAHLVVEVAAVDAYLGPSLRVRAPHGRLPGVCWEDPAATADERAWWKAQLALAKTVDYPDRIHEVYDRPLWAALRGAETARRIDCLSAVGGKHVIDFVDWTTASAAEVPSGTIGAVSPVCERLTVNIRYDPRHPLLNQARLNVHATPAPGRKVTFVFDACTDGPEPAAAPHTPALEPFSMLKDITAHIVEGVHDATFVGLTDIPREALDLPPCTTADALLDAFREAVLDKWTQRARHLPPSHPDHGREFPVAMTQSMRFLPSTAGVWPAGTGCGRSCGDPPIFGSLTPFL